MAYSDHQRNKEISRRRWTGETLQEIAESFGISKQAASGILKRTGGPSAKDLRDVDQQIVIEHFEKGYSVQDIARIIGRTRPYVQRLLTDKGYDPKELFQEYRDRMFHFVIDQHRQGVRRIDIALNLNVSFPMVDKYITEYKRDPQSYDPDHEYTDKPYYAVRKTSACIIDGCAYMRRSVGLCHNHYHKFKRHERNKPGLTLEAFIQMEDDRPRELMEGGVT